jgi:hypothetical protein
VSKRETEGEREKKKEGEGAGIKSCAGEGGEEVHTYRVVHKF